MHGAVPQHIVQQSNLRGSPVAAASQWLQKPPPKAPAIDLDAEVGVPTMYHVERCRALCLLMCKCRALRLQSVRFFVFVNRIARRALVVKMAP